MVNSELKKEWIDTDEAYRELGNAIVIQAVEDWKAAWKDLQKKKNYIPATRLMNSSELFFRSDWYRTLCNYPAKDLMDKLPDMAKNELYHEVTSKWSNAYIVTKVLKPGTKTNDRKICNAYKRMKEAEEDMWSKWFINLYHKHPEDLLEELQRMADKQIEDEAERKMKEKEAEKRARELQKSTKKCTKVYKSVQK